jgi:predicted kinase
MSSAGLAVVINGLPGSGKSTIARRLVATRPGWFLLDVDVLRTFIGGWSRDFAESGRVVRLIAQGIISEVVASGGVVVIPQLFFEVDDFLGFARKAQDAGGEVLHVVVDVPVAECWRRLQARLSDYSEHEVGEESLASVVGAVLEQAGGQAFVERLTADLLTFRECEVPTHFIPGDDTEYALEQLNALLAGHGRATG